MIKAKVGQVRKFAGSTYTVRDIIEDTKTAVVYFNGDIYHFTTDHVESDSLLSEGEDEYYIHFRASNGGGITALVNTKYRTARYSYCSPYDQFSKAEGRRNVGWPYPVLSLSMKDVLREGVRLGPKWTKDSKVYYFTRNQRFSLLRPNRVLFEVKRLPKGLYQSLISFAQQRQARLRRESNRKRQVSNAGGDRQKGKESRGKLPNSKPPTRDSEPASPPDEFTSRVNSVASSLSELIAFIAKTNSD